MDPSSYQSYIFNQKTSLFGNNQEYYIEKSNQAIAYGIKEIESTVAKDSNLREIFFRITDNYAHMRREIAEKTNTPKSKNFGLRRDSEEGVVNGHSYTGLAACYEKYGVTMCQVIQGQLAKMTHDVKSFQEPKGECRSTCMNRKSLFEIEVLDPEALKAKSWTSQPEKSKILQIIGNMPVSSHKAVLQTVKRKAPQYYVQDKMHFIMRQIILELPSPQLVELPDGSKYYEGEIENLKSHWVVATARIEIDGKLWALSQYLTFMYMNHEDDPVERMTGRAKVLIIHQDMFLIEGTLQEIACIFEKAIKAQADTSVESKLVGEVALLRYLFAHAMPYHRGSAAIGEWLERTIYGYHGISVEHSADKACDLEALTSLSLEDFYDRYKKMITLLKK